MTDNLKLPDAGVQLNLFQLELISAGIGLLLIKPVVNSTYVV